MTFGILNVSSDLTRKPNAKVISIYSQICSILVILLFLVMVGRRNAISEANQNVFSGGGGGGVNDVLNFNFQAVSLNRK